MSARPRFTTPRVAPRRLRLLVAACLPAALAFASGCGSAEVRPEPTPLDELDVRAREPITGLQDAPPLGMPRAKLAPQAVLAAEALKE